MLNSIFKGLTDAILKHPILNIAIIFLVVGILGSFRYYIEYYSSFGLNIFDFVYTADWISLGLGKIQLIVIL